MPQPSSSLLSTPPDRPVSLYRLGLAPRLLIALGLSALIWSVVVWSLA